ncbi:MAG: septum formation inhibitor Maf, partial [Cyanobacteria bacterium P01_H01_bin.121]
DTSTPQPNLVAATPVADFGRYWNQGLAEITSYQLEQARYGEIRQGTASLVYVTEPFSASKQVKLDRPAASPPGDDVPVLKLNMTKKFNTGIYPYSMMQSTFAPVDIDQYPHALKITTSSQDWCGQTFMQVNNRPEGYGVEVRSYFEDEGDEDITLTKTWLEDELWNRLRINPDTLPTGEISVIPSTFFTRLRHTPFEPMQAIATLTEAATEPDLKTYTLDYPDQSRTLSIQFSASFPYTIQGWEETYPSGFGQPQLLTTKATMINRILNPYWQHNRNSDSGLRQELGLPI